MTRPLRLVFIGLSLSSSWGNGHATTYRALLRGLARRGHDILFLEQDQPWYAENRDLPDPDFCRLQLYSGFDTLPAHRAEVAAADAVIVGSYVADGVAISAWVQGVAMGVTAFYDIDTPVTLAKLERGDFEYLSPELIPGFDLYLSFTGGPTLHHLVERYGAAAAYPLYCSVDTEAYRPAPQPPRYDLGYLGTYSPDRQPMLERLLLEPARRLPDLRFVVAGSQFPRDIRWPGNVTHVEHVPPRDHCAFYNSCRFALNVTRSDMIRAGYSPSVRLFEAAACGTPVISDRWNGIDSIFAPGIEICLARGSDEVVGLLTQCPEPLRRAIGEAARQRVLTEHSSDRRAAELEETLVRRVDELARQRRVHAAAGGGERGRSREVPPHLRVVK
ncbi:CgeB family protein [Inquilinus limosus]|uniref:CgeB family protein n=1 Tax=Inquilinus limosus TaxID=171674 RepID=UPI00068CEC90|nr:glycosyltransferase [Inquilinus limosus]